MSKTIKDTMAAALTLLIQNETITLDELDNAKLQGWDNVVKLLASKFDVINVVDSHSSILRSA